MDQSAAQLEVINAYGSSDVASPSFNRPRYVRYTSVHAPRDLGPVRKAGFDFEGVVGAESGSQTLFFVFEALLPSRIGLRRILLNPYTDQYVSVFLTNEAGTVALATDGLGDSPAPAASDLAASVVPTFDLGYVLCGHWATGYCENDCRLSSDVAADSGVAVTGGPVLEEILPAGTYSIVISNSEWPGLPYRFQLSVNPPGELSGACDLQNETYGNLALAKLEGKAEMRAAPAGALVRQVALSGIAVTEARPSGTITRTSPYGS